MTADWDTRSTAPPGRHVQTLRVTREESRDVLDTQLEKISSIDEKALRTIRNAVLLLGIALSTGALPNGASLVNWATLGGTISITLSILSGIVTYVTSNPSVGVGSAYLTEAREVPYTEAEWLTLVIAGYSEWIADAEQLATSNVRTLTISQFFLGCGIVLLTVGTLLGLFGHLDPAVSLGR